jgi:hypothetical protein
MEADSDAIRPAMGSRNGRDDDIFDIEVVAEDVLYHVAHPLGQIQAIGVGDENPMILDVILKLDNVLKEPVHRRDAPSGLSNRDHLAIAIHVDQRLDAEEIAHRGADAGDTS